MKKTIELYDQWNDEKKSIELGNKEVFINPRDIWYTKMGMNI